MYKVSIILAAIIFSASCFARTNCMLIVKPATDKEVHKNWETSYGSFDKKISEKKFLSIALTNSNRGTVTYKIKAYFVAETLGGKGRVIYSRKIEEKTLEAGKSWKGVIASDTLEAQDTKYAALGERYTEGGKYDGWILVIEADDKDIKVINSKHNRRYQDKIIELAKQLEKDIKKQER